MKVREILDAHNTIAKVGSPYRWSFSLYDLTGNICYGYINPAYPRKRVHPAILACDVISYCLGYESMSIRVSPVIEAEYQTTERCLMDGYEFVDLKPFNPYIKDEDNRLYVRESSEGWSFAKIL